MQTNILCEIGINIRKFRSRQLILITLAMTALFNTNCCYMCTFLVQYEGLAGLHCVVAAAAGVERLSGLFT